jgi:hypothetical protein
VQITGLKQTSFLLRRPEFRPFLIRSDESRILHCTVHTAQTSFICVVAFGFSTLHDSFRRIGTILLYRSHTSNKLHFCYDIRNFYLLWFFPTNQDFCTVMITRLKETSFLLRRPDFRPFLIRSGESRLLHCTVHTAQTSFICVVAFGFSTFHDSFRRIGTILLYISHGSNKLHFCCGTRNSTFCDSFRRIGNFVLYRSHGSNKTLCCCGVRNFDISWFVPMNRDSFSVQITRLKQSSFLLWRPNYRPFVILFDESCLLYCANHTAQNSLISVVFQ